MSSDIFSRFFKTLFSTRPVTRTVILAALLTLQGCGMVYKTTGDILINFGRSNMLPYMMTFDDPAIGCTSGEALSPLLLAFETVGSDPDKLAVLVYLSAGTCADADALEAELRYLRAVGQGNGSEAQDALIEQKRHAALGAKRQFQAYQRMISEYGEVEEGECPKLKSDFDELIWLAGHLAAVQAMMNDTLAEGSVGVPRDVIAKAERNIACLDNEKWWGVPRGVRATVWSFLPVFAPKGAEPWKELEMAAQTGFKQGVRLGSALYAMSAYSQGDQKRMRKAIRDFAANDENLDPEYRMLDTFAAELIKAVSDRQWTKATGKRTPIGKLGSFWDEKPKGSGVNINDLL